VKLSFIDGIKQPFTWFGGRVFIDWKDSFPIHLETVIHGMIAARRDGAVIRSFEVSGFDSRLAASENELSEIMGDALFNVEDLRLIDSPSLLDFMSNVPLNFVRRLELESCWLCVPDLEKFVISHAKSLQVLHLDDTWMPVEKVYYWGISLCDSSAETILTNIACIRRCGILQELTINKGSTDRYQYHEVFDGFLAK
jgi:hypothetical protein